MMAGHIERTFLVTLLCILFSSVSFAKDSAINFSGDAALPSSTVQIYAPSACGDGGITFIHDIQGAGVASPLLGSEVDVEAIVVAVFQGPGQLSGFFLQEEDADTDANAATSEGLFIFSLSPVAIGDHVRVRGTVAEFFDQTELSPASDVAVCASAEPLPTPAVVTLPVTNPLDFEPFEGMSLSMPQTLTITDVFSTVRYGSYVVSSSRLYAGTMTQSPGAAAVAVEASNALDRLHFDDGRGSSYGMPWVYGQDNATEIAALNPVRNGQTISNATGVMAESFGLYRVHPLSRTISPAGNPRPVAPGLTGGTLRVAGFNVLNFFTNLDGSGSICGPSGTSACWGADSPEELERQLAKLVSAISTIDADIVGLIELENTATDSLQALLDGLNAVMGAGTYAFVDAGSLGTGNQKVGLIYKPAAVTLEGPFAVLDSSVDPRFTSFNRPTLAQSFRATSNLALITIAVNHFKSKGGCPADGPEDDQGDGQACWNPTRTDAARALGDWMNADPTGSGATNYLIIGDLNSHPKEDPLTELINRGFTDMAAGIEGLDAYSFVFFGAVGALDYVLANPALAPKIVDLETWHINNDEIKDFRYDLEDLGPVPKPTSFYNADPYYSSDHDPVIVELDMDPPPLIEVPTTDPQVDAEVEIEGGGASCGFSEAEFVNPATLNPRPPSSVDFPYGVFKFTAERCTPGATVTVSIELPEIPGFNDWYKYLPESGWVIYPATLIGTTFSFEVTDGGIGDADGIVNGIIVDPSGPAIKAATRAIPALDISGLALLILLMTIVGTAVNRRFG